ncbi:hypothetical protein CEXT_258151 [Caerostris extrusa]|uniref:Uncharacterized protein n=1 Tax=Caerostris extrusa TaxID=172846 RepID=A0AAV4P358_CAEEX|nr:hypothetical protein CEXT_258151 [Caerostris extrusa]
MRTHENISTHDIAALSQSENEVEVNKKPVRSHENEEQITEDIHKETVDILTCTSTEQRFQKINKKENRNILPWAASFLENGHFGMLGAMLGDKLPKSETSGWSLNWREIKISSGVWDKFTFCVTGGSEIFKVLTLYTEVSFDARKREGYH